VISEDFLQTEKIYGTYYKCPNCRCELSPYEVFACRIRGLETPVCLGCLADVLVWVKRYLVPMLEQALEMLGKERG